MAILSGFSLEDCHFLFLHPEMDFDFSDYSRMGKTVPFQHILPLYSCVVLHPKVLMTEK